MGISSTNGSSLFGTSEAESPVVAVSAAVSATGASARAAAFSSWLSGLGVTGLRYESNILRYSTVWFFRSLEVKNVANIRISAPNVRGYTLFL
jgi:hypothetical protein